jgi:hypothetical protein
MLVRPLKSSVAALVINTLVIAPVVAQSGQTRPLSPSVLATLVTRGQQIELLVLWRDAPNWYVGRRQRVSGGGDGGTFRTSVQLDDIELSLAYDPTRRTVRIGETTTSLIDGANVVMIDGVADPSERRRSVSVTAVDLSGDSPNPVLGTLLARSPAIVKFLRCETTGDRQVDGAARKGHVCDDLTTAR